MKDIKQMAVEAGVSQRYGAEIPDDDDAVIADQFTLGDLRRIVAMAAEDCARVADETIEHGALDQYGETYAYATAAAIRARWGVKEG